MIPKPLIIPVTPIYNGDPANTDKQIIASLKKQLIAINFKYNAILNSDDAHYAILDKQLHLVDFNIAFGLLIKNGTGKNIKIGQHVNEFTGDLAPQVMANCSRALAGETFIVERHLTYTGQGAGWWEAEYGPAYDANHEIAGVIFNAFNITERKNHEIKIEEQNKQLIAISLMQSHDIRGPLCTLMGLISLIKLGGHLDDTEYMPMLEASVNLLDSKVRNIVTTANL